MEELAEVLVEAETTSTPPIPLELQQRNTDDTIGGINPSAPAEHDAQAKGSVFTFSSTDTARARVLMDNSNARGKQIRRCCHVIISFLSVMAGGPVILVRALHRVRLTRRAKI